jgi:hypothetical protein
MVRPSQNIELGQERPLTPEEEEQVWEALHRNMKGDDRYPAEVMMGPPYNGDRSKYLNAMRWHLNGQTPF